jgi:uncharacterized protein (DUF1800 family)
MKALDRRRFLQLGGLSAAAPISAVESLAGIHRGWRARDVADMPAPDLETLTINRAAFGPRPGQLEALRATGVRSWVERQLDWQKIDDRPVENLLKQQIPSLSMPAPELWALYQDNQQRNAITQGLRAATIYRMLFSERQLYEVMVDFWSDHFSIDQNATFARVLKTLDDREVIRKHALGRFRDLVSASAQSPCMLNYLDNDSNTKNRPNENYARELLELHTLGVASGGVPYSEDDVKAVARCFTGWGWNNGRRDVDKGGLFEFSAGLHDNGVKTVLGQLISASQGEQDGHIVIDLLCQHPATARFIATKLVRRFVADDPQRQVPELVDAVTQSFLDTQGDIRAMLRTILFSEAFAGSFAAYGGRLARPMDHVVRSLRVAGLQPAHLGQDFGARVFTRFASALYGGRGVLTAMNHVPFAWETPDGYPDVKERWTSTGILLARWNFGLMLAEGGVVEGFKPESDRPAGLTKAGEIVDWWTARLLLRPVLDADRQLLVDYLSAGGGAGASPAAGREPYLMALILDSPYFMWR